MKCFVNISEAIVKGYKHELQLYNDHPDNVYSDMNYSLINY